MATLARSTERLPDDQRPAPHRARVGCLVSTEYAAHQMRVATRKAALAERDGRTEAAAEWHAIARHWHARWLRSIVDHARAAEVTP